MTEDPAFEQQSTEHAGATDGLDPAAHTNIFRGLFASLLEAARTRLDLATVEAEIFLVRAIQMLLWALAALACALLALAFLVIALVAALWDTHRMVGILSGAGVFIVLAGIFGYVSTRTFKGHAPMLAGTLAQLETDAHRARGEP
jgi:uncharacterized membrane protein YqjE